MAQNRIKVVPSHSNFLLEYPQYSYPINPPNKNKREISDKGIRFFIVLYPPKRSHDLPPLAGTVHTETISFSPGDIPEQLAAYSAHALSTALFMLGTHFAAG